MDMIDLDTNFSDLAVLYFSHKHIVENKKMIYLRLSDGEYTYALTGTGFIPEKKEGDNG